MIETFSQNVFEGVATGVALCRHNGGFLAVNQAFCEITGRSQDELLTLRYQDITHPDDMQHEANTVADVLAGKIRRFVLEKRYIRNDGVAPWVRVSGSLVPDGAGGQAILAVIEDLTAIKLAQKALEDARAHLKLPASAACIAEEASRRRLGRRLHNGPAQLVTALAMNLAVIRTHVSSAEGLDDLVATAIELAEQCSHEIRIAASLLETPDVPRYGLPAALNTWLRGFSRRTTMEIETAIDSAVRLDPAAEQTMFRIVQEALAEISDLAPNSSTRVALQYEHAEIVLSAVYDAGRADRGPRSTAAWVGLRERAELMGGRVTTISRDNGAGLEIRVPRPSE